MIIELAAIISPLVGGVLGLRVLGLRGWGLVPLGFLAGLFFELTVGTLQLTARVATNPLITLAVTMFAPLVWWLVQWRRGKDVTFDWRPTPVVVAGVVGLVAAFRSLNVVRWHVDSLVYLNIGELLANGNYYDAVSNYLLVKRLIGVPFMHAPAALDDETYVRSIVPIMSIAILGSFVWFLRRGLTGRIPAAQITLFSVLGIGFLVTANRFVFHALYLNGHLLVGGAILIIAATAWLLARGEVADARFLLPLSAVAMVAVVVTRPEGLLYCVLTLVPAVLSPHISLRHRRILAGSLAGAGMLWYGTCVSLALQFDFAPATTLVEMLALSVLLAGATWALGLRWLSSRQLLLVRLSELGVWLVLAAFTAMSTKILTRSVSATAANTVSGKWGLTLIMTAMLVIGAVTALRASHSVYLRFAVTTFFPMALVLAYVRGGEYREGHFDSLNRMWLQILPLAVFFVAAMLAEGTWAPRWPRGWHLESASGEPAASRKRAARA